MKTFLDNIKRINKFDEMIRSEKTGPPDKCAETLHCAESTFNDFLRFYRDLIKPKGISIIFDDEFQTYRYSKKGSFHIELIWDVDKNNV